MFNQFVFTKENQALNNQKFWEFLNEYKTKNSLQENPQNKEECILPYIYGNDEIHNIKFGIKAINSLLKIKNGLLTSISNIEKLSLNELIEIALFTSSKIILPQETIYFDIYTKFLETKKIITIINNNILNFIKFYKTLTKEQVEKYSFEELTYIYYFGSEEIYLHNKDILKYFGPDINMQYLIKLLKNANENDTYIYIRAQNPEINPILQGIKIIYNKQEYEPIYQSKPPIMAKSGSKYSHTQGLNPVNIFNSKEADKARKLIELKELLIKLLKEKTKGRHIPRIDELLKSNAGSFTEIFKELKSIYYNEKNKKKFNALIDFLEDPQKDNELKLDHLEKKIHVEFNEKIIPVQLQTLKDILGNLGIRKIKIPTNNNAFEFIECECLGLSQKIYPQNTETYIEETKKILFDNFDLIFSSTSPINKYYVYENKIKKANGRQLSTLQTNNNDSMPYDALKTFNNKYKICISLLESFFKGVKCSETTYDTLMLGDVDILLYSSKNIEQNVNINNFNKPTKSLEEFFENFTNYHLSDFHRQYTRCFIKNINDGKKDISNLFLMHLNYINNYPTSYNNIFLEEALSTQKIMHGQEVCNPYAHKQNLKFGAVKISPNNKKIEFLPTELIGKDFTNKTKKEYITFDNPLLDIPITYTGKNKIIVKSLKELEKNNDLGIIEYVSLINSLLKNYTLTITNEKQRKMANELQSAFLHFSFFSLDSLENICDIKNALIYRNTFLTLKKTYEDIYGENSIWDKHYYAFINNIYEIFELFQNLNLDNSFFAYCIRNHDKSKLIFDTLNNVKTIQKLDNKYNKINNIIYQQTQTKKNGKQSPQQMEH